MKFTDINISSSEYKVSISIPYLQAALLQEMMTTKWTINFAIAALKPTIQAILVQQGIERKYHNWILLKHNHNGHSLTYSICKTVKSWQRFWKPVMGLASFTMRKVYN